MHVIQIDPRQSPAFDAALRRHGLEPLSSSLLAIDEKRRAAILKSSRRGRAQFRSRNWRRQKAKDDARAQVDGGGPELKTTMPQLEAATKAAEEERHGAGCDSEFARWTKSRRRRRAWQCGAAFILEWCAIMHSRRNA